MKSKKAFLYILAGLTCITSCTEVLKLTSTTTLPQPQASESPIIPLAMCAIAAGFLLYNVYSGATRRKSNGLSLKKEKGRRSFFNNIFPWRQKKEGIQLKSQLQQMPKSEPIPIENNISNNENKIIFWNSKGMLINLNAWAGNYESTREGIEADRFMEFVRENYTEPKNRYYMNIYKKISTQYLGPLLPPVILVHILTPFIFQKHIGILKNYTATFK